MEYYCTELQKEFKSLPELHKALKANENNIISIKKSAIHKSAEKGQFSVIGAYLKSENVEKAGIDFKEDFIYPVINTTKYMDSHHDVHFDGIWKKTIKEQQGNIYYIDNHSFKVDDIIAWKEDVRVFTKMIPWSLVGKDFEGETEALIFEISKDNLKKQTAIDAINEKRDVQNSVAMLYVTIKLGLNSDDKEYRANKRYFDKRYAEISNKEEVDKYGFFWGIEEAKIYREGSLVLAGSNDATSMLTTESKDNEPLKDTQIGEPLKGTRTDEPLKDTQKRTNNLYF